MTDESDKPSKERHVNIKIFLEDMRESAAAIEGYIDNMTKSEFLLDRMRQDAVIRRLEIIGEAAGRIMKADQQFEASFPDIPLRNAYEMRNFVSHGYDAVDPRIVWDTATKDIPSLVRTLEKVLAGQKKP